MKHTETIELKVGRQNVVRQLLREGAQERKKMKKYQVRINHQSMSSIKNPALK
jgi:hypothetical protein